MTNKQLQSTIIPWRSSSSFHAIASFYMETKSLSRKFSRGKISRRFDANTRMSFASCLYFEWRLIDSRIEVCYSNKDKSVFQWKIHSSFQSDQLWQDYIISRCSGQILDIFVAYCPRSLLATYQGDQTTSHARCAQGTSAPDNWFRLIGEESGRGQEFIKRTKGRDKRILSGTLNENKQWN